GFDVHVYEQSRALREVGAGINVTPNATRVIHGLGLDDKLASLGVRPDGRASAALGRRAHTVAHAARHRNRTSFRFPAISIAPRRRPHYARWRPAARAHAFRPSLDWVLRTR